MMTPKLALFLILAAGVIGTVAMAATPTPPEPVSGASGGCAAAMKVTLASTGWQHPDDGRPFAPARLEAFRAKAVAAFRKAANHACAAVPAVQRAMATVKAVQISPGAGATEATFYRDADQLIFQYAFAEAGLTPPPQADIEQGLRCFAEPKRRECADMGD